MSEITFMIGNGFDKHLGLDTGYNQFLEWYIRNPSSPTDTIKQFKQELANNSHSEWWSDAEMAMGKYANKFNSDSMTDFFDILEDFKEKLVTYLHKQEDRCDFSDTQAIGDVFAHFLLNFQKDILLQSKIGTQFSRENNLQFNFLTFNYTKVLEELIRITKKTRTDGNLYKTQNPHSSLWSIGKIGPCYSVHGSLKSSIVMGVNDESQIDFPRDQIPPHLRRILVKSRTIKAAGLKGTNRGCEILDSSDTIAIFGLKLGDSDKTWKQNLWNWLQLPHHSVVLFEHDDRPGISTFSPVIDKTLRYEDEKQTAFLKKLEPNINQDGIESYRDRIFVIPRTKQLKLNLIRK